MERNSIASKAFVLAALIGLFTGAGLTSASALTLYSSYTYFNQGDIAFKHRSIVSDSSIRGGGTVESTNIPIPAGYICAAGQLFRNGSLISAAARTCNGSSTSIWINYAYSTTYSTGNITGRMRSYPYNAPTGTYPLYTAITSPAITL